MSDSRGPGSKAEAAAHRSQAVFVTRPDVAGRLQEALGVLEAISQGELLAGSPADPNDRARHEAGLATLAVLGRELERLLVEVRAYEEISGYSAIERAAMGFKS